MRHALSGPSLMAAVFCLGAGAATAKPLPPAAGEAMPPVELTIAIKDGKAVCAPAELRLPADTNVELHIDSSANQTVTLTMEDQFEKGHVLHADGDAVHVASEKGYTIKQNGKATIRLRTLSVGERPFACTGTASQSDPFRGKVILSAPAG